MKKEQLIEQISKHPEHVNVLYTPEQSAMFTTVNRIYSPTLDTELLHVGNTVIFVLMDYIGLNTMNDWYTTGADLASLPKLLDHIVQSTVQPFLLIQVDTEDSLLTVYAIAKEGSKKEVRSKSIDGIQPVARLIINLSTWQIESAPLEPELFGITVNDFDDEDAILHVIDGTEFSRHWCTTFGQLDGKYQPTMIEEPTTLN